MRVSCAQDRACGNGATSLIAKIGGEPGRYHSDKQGTYHLVEDTLVNGHSVYKLEDSHKTLYIYYDVYDDPSEGRLLHWVIGPYLDSHWGHILANPTASCPTSDTFSYAQQKVIAADRADGGSYRHVWANAQARDISLTCVTAPAMLERAAEAAPTMTLLTVATNAALLCGVAALILSVAAPRLLAAAHPTGRLLM